MTPIQSFVLTQLPIVSLIIFIVGSALRLITWLRRDVKGRIGGGHRITNFLLIYRRIEREGFTAGWFAAALLHWAFIGTLIGHVRGIGVWSIDWFTWLMPKEVLYKLFVEQLALVVGIIFIATSVFILLKRASSGLPKSRIGYYVSLSLILLIVISATIVRLLPHTPQQLTFELLPGIPLIQEKTPNMDFLTLHVLFSEIFIAYLPFSFIAHAATLITGGVGETSVGG